MSNSERMRARYADRKARGVCADCEAPSADFSRCPDCRTRCRIAGAQYDKRNPEVSRNRMRRLYQQDPERFRARERERRLAKKLRGECEKCPAPAADGSAYCAHHAEARREARRDYNARRAAGGAPKKGGVRPGATRTPMPVVECACGSQKEADRSCCDRCARLDGMDVVGSPARVLDALRDDSGSGMSLRDLCEALGMNTDIKNGHRQMWRWVKSLLEQGRVRRYWREGVGESYVTESFRDGATRTERSAGCWAYLLNWSTEARAA